MFRSRRRRCARGRQAAESQRIRLCSRPFTGFAQTPSSLQSANTLRRRRAGQCFETLSWCRPGAGRRRRSTPLIDLKSTLPLWTSVRFGGAMYSRDPIEERRLHPSYRRQEIRQVARLGTSATGAPWRIANDVSHVAYTWNNGSGTNMTPRRVRAMGSSISQNGNPIPLSTAVCADDPFWCPGRAAAHQQGPPDPLDVLPHGGAGHGLSAAGEPSR